MFRLLGLVEARQKRAVGFAGPGGAGGADINKLNVASTVYKDMFPTNKRIERVMNHTSVGCEDLTPDPAAQDKKLLWGGGSVKVYCEQ